MHEVWQPHYHTHACQYNCSEKHQVDCRLGLGHVSGIHFPALLLQKLSPSSDNTHSTQAACEHARSMVNTFTAHMTPSVPRTDVASSRNAVVWQADEHRALHAFDCILSSVRPLRATTAYKHAVSNEQVKKHVAEQLCNVRIHFMQSMLTALCKASSPPPCMGCLRPRWTCQAQVGTRTYTLFLLLHG